MRKSTMVNDDDIFIGKLNQMDIHMWFLKMQIRIDDLLKICSYNLSYFSEQHDCAPESPTTLDKCQGIALQIHSMVYHNSKLTLIAFAIGLLLEIVYTHFPCHIFGKHLIALPNPHLPLHYPAHKSKPGDQLTAHEYTLQYFIIDE